MRMMTHNTCHCLTTPHRIFDILVMTVGVDKEGLSNKMTTNIGLPDLNK